MAQILILGDSHVHAINRAHLRDRGRLLAGHEAFISRFSKFKAETGRIVAGVTFEEALERAGRLGSADLLVSVIGGNEYNIFGMVQHPRPFDYVEPDMAAALRPDAELIPSTTFDAMFDSLIERGTPRLRLLREATVARMVHLAPPPPKEDDAFVLERADTLFKTRNIHEMGVSPAILRLKLWFTQLRLMRRLCATLGVTLLAPPPAALTSDGFLDPRYYGNDATHANHDYGALVLAMLATQAATLEKAA